METEPVYDLANGTTPDKLSDFIRNDINRFVRFCETVCGKTRFEIETAVKSFGFTTRPSNLPPTKPIGGFTIKIPASDGTFERAYEIHD